MPTARPYVVLSCAMSADGYLDDASDRRLLLSDDAEICLILPPSERTCRASQPGCSVAGDLTQPESDQHKARP